MKLVFKTTVITEIIESLAFISSSAFGDSAIIRPEVT